MSQADAEGRTPSDPGAGVAGDGPTTPPMRISHAVMGPTVLWWLRATVTGDDIRPQPVSGRQELLENIVNRYV